MRLIDDQFDGFAWEELFAVDEREARTGYIFGIDLIPLARPLQIWQGVNVAHGCRGTKPVPSELPSVVGLCWQDTGLREEIFPRSRQLDVRRQASDRFR